MNLFILYSDRSTEIDEQVDIQYLRIRYRDFFNKLKI